MPEVVQISDLQQERRRTPIGEREMERRRLAVQLVSQLPANPVEAIAVLILAQALIERFFLDDLA